MHEIFVHLFYCPLKYEPYAAVPYFLSADAEEEFSVGGERPIIGGGHSFEGIARVFAPLVSCLDDVEMAVTWYVKHHNTTRRPFVLIGEGQGGELLKTFAEENREWLVGKGFVASFYSKTPDPHFVSDEMIRMIKIRSAGARYQREWGRVVPEGLLEK